MNAVPRSQGFTLIELLVAITILAIVAVMALRGLTALQTSYAQTQRIAQYWRGIALFFDRFGFDVSQPANRAVNNGGLEAAWLGIAATDAHSGAEVHFTRKAILAGEDDQRLGYRQTGNRIELLVWPVLDVDAEAVPPRIYPLLEGVQSLQLRYLGAGNQWQDSWSGTPALPLPRAVAVDLMMSDGIEIKRIFATQ